MASDNVSRALEVLIAEGQRQERARVLAIVNHYRQMAGNVEDPEQRERAILWLGLMRSDIEHGR